MKAERRHELKTNSLAKGIESAPAFFQQYGSRVLLGVILCLLAVILVKNHVRDKDEKAANASKSLGAAMYYLSELRTLPLQELPDQLAASRKELAKSIESSVSEVISNAEDPKVLAQAWIVRGDLNWQLANFPALPTTQPSSNPDKTNEEYLTAAADSYNKVLQAPLNDDHLSVISARFGLGKIAENRGQWKESKDYYQQVADDSAAETGFKEWAKDAIEQLKLLEKPVYGGTGIPFAKPPAPSTQPLIPLTPATAPATGPAAPTVAPSTQPATDSAAPAVAPSTQPATDSAAPAVAPTIAPATQPATSAAAPATQPAIGAPAAAPATQPAPPVAAPATQPSHP